MIDAARAPRVPPPIFLAAFLIILGSRLGVIGRAASLVPFWDEWDAEFTPVLLPWARGEFHLGSLFGLNNEHRIAVTRVFDLGLVAVQHGHWRVVTEMIAVQTIVSAAAVLLLRFLAVGLGPWRAGGVLAIGTAILALPFDWEAAVWAFDSQIYFCAMAAVAGLALVGARRPGNSLFWIGIGILLAGMLCFAASIAALLAAIVVVVARHAAHRDRRITALAVALLGGGAALLIATTPSVPASMPLRATSLAQCAEAALRVLAWPLPWPAAPLIWAPAVIYLVRCWAHRGRIDHNALTWPIAGIACWNLLIAAELGYGRAGAPTLSRYAVFFSVGLLLNISCAFRLAAATGWRGAAIAWGAIVAAGVLLKATTLPHDIAYRRYLADLQTSNVAAYVRSGELSVLHKGGFTIPYPDGTRLATMLHMGIDTRLLPEKLSQADTPKGQRWRKRLARLGRALMVSGTLAAALLAACRLQAGLRTRRGMSRRAALAGSR